MANRKSFTIVKRISKTFTIVIDGFSQLLAWTANIQIPEFILTASAIIKAKFTASIEIEDFVLSSIVHLKNSLQTDISFQLQTAISSVRLAYAYAETISFPSPIITSITHLRYFLSGTNEMPLSFVVSSVLVGVKNYLGDFVGRNPTSLYFDDSILGDLDSLTLGEMDFTEI